MAITTGHIVDQMIRTAAAAPLNDVCDRDLLHRFATASDERAFAALVRRHSDLVMGVCRRSLATEQDAEDAYQATFLVLAQKANTERWQPSVANWLYATARKVARNARRSAERRARREGRAAVPEAVAPIDTMTGRELLAVLDEELDKLPPIYREPLVLCYLTGLSREEAAARLDAPAATVKTRLERARKRLGRALTKRGCALGVGLLAVAATSRAGASPPRLLDAVLSAAAGRPSATVAALARGVAVNGVSFQRWALAAALIVGAAALAVGYGRGRPVAAEPPSANAVPASDAKVNKDGTSVTVSGRVLGPDGKQVAGAKLFTEKMLRPDPWTMTDIGLDSVGQSTADGSFRVALKSQSAFPRRYLGAFAPGFAIDWVEWTEVKATEDVTLRLVKEQPITGRVINTEGKPVAGVSVSVTAIAVPKDNNLDDYLARWKKDWQDSFRAAEKLFAVPLEPITGAVITDKDGKFTLSGVAPERIAYVSLSGRGLANSSGRVIMRQGFNPKPYNEGVRDDRPLAVRSRRQAPILYGPEMTVVAEPGVSITGVVKDVDSGKLLAGCRVATYFGSEGASATTDADGTYTLAGIPKEKAGYSVSASFPKGTSTYLLRRKQVADADGYEPIRLDIELIKGAVVTGRITDKRTGRGVVAGIRFAPLSDNKFFASKPGFDNYLRDRTMSETDADGRFQLVTIPGRALVMAQIRGNLMLSGQPLCPYRRAVPDESERQLFKYDKADDMWTIATAGGTEFLMSENAVRVIDIKPEGVTKVELLADAGATGKLTIQDADGKPLTGAWVAGLTEHWPITYQLSEPTATIYALTPGKPRTLFVYHPAKKLGGNVTVRGDETEPVVAKLDALGKVTGRLRDADGSPLAGVDVSIGPVGVAARELYRFANFAGKSVRTGNDGRFTVTDVVPGMSFYLDAHREKEYFGGKPKIGLQSIKPSETLDLGDRMMELLR